MDVDYKSILESLNHDLDEIGEKYLYENANDDAVNYAIKEDVNRCVTGYLETYPALRFHINELQGKPMFQPNVTIFMWINGNRKEIIVHTN